MSVPCTAVCFTCVGVQAVAGAICRAADQSLLQKKGREESGSGKEVLCAVVHEQKFLQTTGNAQHSTGVFLFHLGKVRKSHYIRKRTADYIHTYVFVYVCVGW